MVLLQNFKAAFLAALTLLLLVISPLNAGLIYEFDNFINDKTTKKLKEIGDELYKKTGVTTAIVAKQHLDQKEFLEIKNRYLKELKPPYVLWIFAKTYMDRENIGINQMFNSEDLNDKFDKDSLFSPWGGTFTKVLTVHKSKTDPTAAAFLNGYGDLTDMIASSYGVKLDSSIGHETQTTINIVRILFYLSIAFFFVWYLQVKFSKGNK